MRKQDLIKFLRQKCKLHVQHIECWYMYYWSLFEKEQENYFIVPAVYHPLKYIKVPLFSYIKHGGNSLDEAILIDYKCYKTGQYRMNGNCELFVQSIRRGIKSVIITVAYMPSI